jgi:hypothetical protein
LKIAYLNLPALSNRLIDTLTDIALSFPYDLEGKLWLENFHKNKYQIVSQVYGRGNTFMTPELQQEINDLYSPYFNQPVLGVLGNLSNAEKNGESVCPPHCDRYRKMAINCILQTGGDNVKTCFYNEARNSDNLEEAANELYDNVTLDFEIQLPAQTWHAYDVQHFHSVNGVTATRVIFSLVPYNNIDFATFVKQHPELLK